MNRDSQPLGRQKSYNFPAHFQIFSIANQLRYGLVLLVAFSVVVTGGILIYLSFQAQLEQLLLVQQERSRAVASEINAYLDDLQRKVNYLSRISGLADLPPEIQQNLLDALIRHNSAYQTTAILDDTGQVVVSASLAGPALLPDNLADSALFARAFKRQEDFVGPVEVDPVSQLPVVTLAVPIRNRQDEVAGVLLARVDLSFLWFIVSQARVGETGYTYVIDNRNILLAQTGTAPENFSLVDISDRPYIQQLISGGETLTTYQGLNGVEVIGNLAPIHSVRWSVLTELPTAEAYAPSRNMLIVMGVALVGAIALAVGSGLFLTQEIVEPLQRLTEASAQVSAGRMDVAVEVNTRNEMRILAATFNTMTAHVRRLVGGLESRTRRLEIIANLSEQLTSILNLEELLAAVVQQTQQNFGYYHVQIYLFDDDEQHLIVAEGSGLAGQEMKARRYRIPLSAQTNPVARAAHTGQMVQVGNVREIDGWQPYPHLPDVYAEIAVPIIIEGQRVGVLNVLEDEIAGLDEGDANLLRSLANHVAVAIRNARLFAQVEQALAEAHLAQERYTQQVWQRPKQIKPYLYQQPDAPLLVEETLTEAKRQALSLSQTTAMVLSDPQAEPEAASGHAILAAPVRLGQNKIGAFQLHRTDITDGQSPWTNDDLALIEAVLDQVAQTAENLRLFEETRDRAARERTIREITDKLRAAPNLKQLVEIATEELGERLAAKYTKLELGFEKSAGNGHNQPE
jgi:GAF domain-containing protein/HAMP domain-containing protein